MFYEEPHIKKNRKKNLVILFTKIPNLCTEFVLLDGVHSQNIYYHFSKRQFMVLLVANEILIIKRYF